MLDELAAAIVGGKIIGVNWDKGALAANARYERPDCNVVVKLKFYANDGREWTVEPTADGQEVDAQWLLFTAKDAPVAEPVSA